MIREYKCRYCKETWILMSDGSHLPFHELGPQLERVQHEMMHTGNEKLSCYKNFYNDLKRETE
jgi:hypothetical protein